MVKGGDLAVAAAAIRMGLLRVDGHHRHGPSGEREGHSDEHNELLHGLAPRSAVLAAAIRMGLLRVHHGRRGGEESEAENQEQQYLFHNDLPSCQQAALLQSAIA